MTKIWEYYFFKEQSKFFLFCLFAFLGLYALVDYAAHTSAFSNIHHHFFLLGHYYFYIFIQRVDILVPLAILIATTRTLCDLNVHNECIALMGAGVTKRRLLKPFIIFGVVFVLLSYLNQEFLVPKASLESKRLEELYFKRSKATTDLQTIRLPDQSLLFYQKYEHAYQRFFDVVWVSSIDKVYRMKYLYPKDVTEAQFVDLFVRNGKGELEYKESYPALQIPQLKLNQDLLTDAFISVSQYSIRNLFRLLPEKKQGYEDKRAKMLTTLYSKLTMPWLNLLVIIAVSPFCLVFTRKLPVLLIFIISIFSLVCTYLIFNAAKVMGENGVFSPEIAIGVPFVFVSVLSFFNFFKKW